MRPKLSAFHGKQEIKDKFISRMKLHMQQDQLIQGTGYDGEKGCAVGCTLDNYSHMGYETKLGIPFIIAILEDEIFESLSKKKSKSFPLQFLESVNVGADLSNVYNQMEIFYLQHLITKMKNDEEKKVCSALILLHENVINGIETTDEQWKNLVDRAYLADRADRADRAYLADRADTRRDKFIELIIASK